MQGRLSIRQMLEQHGQRINLMSLGNSLKNSDQGFSIVESLIAIIILGIVFAGGMAFFYQANTLYYRGLHSKIAAWLADSKLEEIKDLGCTAATQDLGTTVAINKLTGVRKVTWPTVGVPDPCLATTVKPACSPLTAVGVCVTWTEPNFTVDREVGISTYVGE